MRGKIDLPGSSTKGRKRRHSVSSSDFEDDSSARHKSSKDDADAISITASEEDVNELLWTSSEPGATTDAQTDVNDELLTELSAGLIDDEKKGPKVTKLQAAMGQKTRSRENNLNSREILATRKLFGGYCHASEP